MAAWYISATEPRQSTPTWASNLITGKVSKNSKKKKYYVDTVETLLLYLTEWNIKKVLDQANIDKINDDHTLKRSTTLSLDLSSPAKY